VSKFSKAYEAFFRKFLAEVEKYYFKMSPERREALHATLEALDDYALQHEWSEELEQYMVKRLRNILEWVRLEDAEAI